VDLHLTDSPSIGSMAHGNGVRDDDLYFTVFVGIGEVEDHRRLKASLHN
jgi:hypothetical protein